MIIVGLFLTISELRVYLKHDSTTDQLVLWGMVFVAGLITAFLHELVLGLLVGISVIMIIETVKMWDTPVWGQLMAATTITYLVILFGKIGQVIHNRIISPGSTSDQIFATAFNISFFVFIAVAFVFFGRKFILVSRLSSPQMIYLFLFGMMYGLIAYMKKQNILFNKNTVSYDYLGISQSWTSRVIFADFGTFEALVIVMIFMYLISGWMLSVLFGVKDVTDPAILKKVKEVAETMGIKDELKVGWVKVPILNAFAYGPFFDKRIAFMANDLNEFSDSDIRGVIGHELAHAAKHHVLILLFLSILELAVKKALGFPATTLDYSFYNDAYTQKIPFELYYAFSYIFLVFLMIFVRLLEGHADKVTKDVGYGLDLSKALYRLEGFYNGVASDFGISVNLLTDRTYSIHEKRRFNAQAARNLYSEVVSPSRGSAFANIFQSHPRTSYRITAMVSEGFSPIKAALFPYKLLGFGLRKNSIKRLNHTQSQFYKIIDETYLEDYGEEAAQEVLKYNPLEEGYKNLVGRQVISYNKFSKKFVEGVFNEIRPSNRVTSPLIAVIDEEEVDLATTLIREYNEGEKYFLRHGEIVKVVGHQLHANLGALIKVENNNSEQMSVGMEKLGTPVKFITNMVGKQIVFFTSGLSRLGTLTKVELNDSWNSSIITIDDNTYPGSDLIIDFPPIGVEIRKERLEQQLPLIKHFIGKKILLFTKENFDVSLAGFVENVTEEIFTLVDADGSHDIQLDTIEYIVCEGDIVEIVEKSHLSVFTKLGIRWTNRNEFHYVYPQ